MSFLRFTINYLCCITMLGTMLYGALSNLPGETILFCGIVAGFTGFNALLEWKMRDW